MSGNSHHGVITISLCFQASVFSLAHVVKTVGCILLLCGNPTFFPSSKHVRGKLCSTLKWSILFTHSLNNKHTYHFLCIRHCYKTVYMPPKQLCGLFHLQRSRLSKAEGWSLNLGKEPEARCSAATLCVLWVTVSWVPLWRCSHLSEGQKDQLYFSVEESEAQGKWLLQGHAISKRKIPSLERMPCSFII